MSVANNSWWCWLVLAGTFYISFTVDGYNIAFGILKLEIEYEHNSTISKESVSIIGGLVPALYCLLAPIAFGLVAVFSVRSMTICGALLSSSGFFLAFANRALGWGFTLDVISLGVIQGIASAFLYGPSINLIPTYFRVDQKGFATGITTCGSPAGAIVYGHMMHVLIRAFDWRGSMLFFAFSSGFIVLAGMTFIPKDSANDSAARKKSSVDGCETPPEKVLAVGTKSSAVDVRVHSGEQPLLSTETKTRSNGTLEGEGSVYSRLCSAYRNIFNRELFQEHVFITLLIAMAFSILGYYVPTLLVTGQAKEPKYNVSENVQEYLIWLWGIANLFGRLFVGFMADLAHLSRFFSSLSLFVIGLFISAICVIVFPFVMHYGDVSFIIFVIIYGFFSAPFITLRSTVVQDLYYDRKEQIASSFGWTLWAEGLVIVAGFWLATFFNSIDPLWAYVFAAGSFIVSALFLLVSLRHFMAMYSKKMRDVVREQQMHPHCVP